VEGSDDPADDNHRWPDIVCTHPLEGHRYVLDCTIAWKALSDWGVGYDTTRQLVKAVEQRKITAYAKAKACEKVWWWRTIRFVPLAFEVSRFRGGGGRGDGRSLRRVRAAQEVAPERREVSLVCKMYRRAEVALCSKWCYVRSGRALPCRSYFC
jgi:hypothetical protein